jgi:CheY-like chemotaxis protein
MIRPARRSEVPEPPNASPRGGGAGAKLSPLSPALGKPRPFSFAATRAPGDPGAAPDSAKNTFSCEETRAGVEGEPKPTTASVLVVDDNIKVRIDLRGALHTAGFLVTACDSRVGALKALKSRSFDLVILDVLLQDGTGLELLRILRDTPETADTPVILLSSDVALKERARILGLSVEEVLPKPLNVALLTKCARRLVRIPIPHDAPSEQGKASAEGLRPPPNSVRPPPNSVRPPPDSMKPPADSMRSAADSMRSAADSIRSAADSSRSHADSSRSLADSSRSLAEAVKSSRAGARDDTSRPGEGPLSVGSAWRNQDDVPSGSMLYRALLQSGVAGVIGPVTVARACRRAGVETSSTSATALMKALPALRDTLRLFLTGEETERHIKKLESVLRGRSPAQ